MNIGWFLLIVFPENAVSYYSQFNVLWSNPPTNIPMPLYISMGKQFIFLLSLSVNHCFILLVQSEQNWGDMIISVHSCRIIEMLDEPWLSTLATALNLVPKQCICRWLRTIRSNIEYGYYGIYSAWRAYSSPGCVTTTSYRNSNHDASMTIFQ
jgi:hypothetical protein